MNIMISKRLIDDIIDQVDFIREKVEILKYNIYISQCIKEAKLYINCKKYKEAEVFLKRALIIDSSSAEIENLLGIIEEKKGNVILAQRYYRAALAFDPCYIPADNNLKRTVLYNSGILNFDLG